MSQLFRVCLLAAAMTAIGCSSGTPEIGPVKETKQADPELMKKSMEESMKRNNAASGGRTTLEAPTEQNKTP